MLPQVAAGDDVTRLRHRAIFYFLNFLRKTQKKFEKE